MSDKRIEKQTKELVAHMNDYVEATRLHKKGEAAIFDKHRIGEKEFGPGLNEELTNYRTKHAEEWGLKGWRNTQFVKNQIDEAQRPSEDEVEKMHEEQMNDTTVAAAQVEADQKRQEFKEGLKEARQNPRQGPKPR